MREYLSQLLTELTIEPTEFAIHIAIFLIIAITAIVIHIILHKIILKLVRKIDNKKSNFLTASLLDDSLFERLALTIQGVIVYKQASIWLSPGKLYEIISMTSQIWISLFLLLVFYSVIDRISTALYKATRLEIFNIKSVIQSIKLIFTIICIIIIISIIVDKSPVVILSGLGAMSAVLMLVFKDTILGFSAGLQLSSNDMVQVGDWIEMKKYDADGDVIDIGINVVKVRNFDKTITTIPTYALVSDSFKNWRGMRESGGRRIKRALPLDVTSIGFLSPDDVARLEKANLLAPYLKQKQEEIKKHNEEHNFDLSVKINGRRLTNIGTLRAYIVTYLKNHPLIDKDKTIMVRQLSPNQYGLPLEIYCFTATTVWVDYEDIQSAIFDHIYSVLGEFGIRPYQYSK